VQALFRGGGGRSIKTSQGKRGEVKDEQLLKKYSQGLQKLVGGRHVLSERGGVARSGGLELIKSGVARGSSRKKKKARSLGTGGCSGYYKHIG